MRRSSSDVASLSESFRVKIQGCNPEHRVYSPTVMVAYEQRGEPEHRRDRRRRAQVGRDDQDRRRTRVCHGGGSGTVAVIDPKTNTAIAAVPVGKRPWNMALTANGAKLYVANGRSNSVSVIDTAANAAVRTLAVGALPWGVAIR